MQSLGLLRLQAPAAVQGPIAGFWMLLLVVVVVMERHGSSSSRLPLSCGFQRVQIEAISQLARVVLCPCQRLQLHPHGVGVGFGRASSLADLASSSNLRRCWVELQSPIDRKHLLLLLLRPLLLPDGLLLGLPSCVVLMLGAATDAATRPQGVRQHEGGKAGTAGVQAQQAQHVAHHSEGAVTCREQLREITTRC